jgi:hypothetical protein
MSKLFDKFEVFSEIVKNPFMVQDALGMLCGAKLGSGAYRDVYDFPMIPGTVIKIAHNVTANIVEFEIWDSVRTTVNKKWFARCLFLSPGGHFLIQKKVRPIRATDKLPKVLPDAFTDIKKENRGFIGKQLVCHDYQFLSRAFDCAFVTKRKVEWL